MSKRSSNQLLGRKYSCSGSFGHKEEIACYGGGAKIANSTEKRNMMDFIEPKKVIAGIGELKSPKTIRDFQGRGQIIKNWSHAYESHT